MRFKILFCLTLFTLSIKGQGQRFSKLDAVLKKIEKKNQAMGSISFSENGKTTYSKAFGFSEIKSQKRSDTSTKFRIGSVSKLFTTVIILQLVSEQKLEITDKVSTFFPTLSNLDKITIEQLLRHESGIFNFGKNNDPKYAKYDPKTQEEIIAIFEKEPLVFKPGKKVDYNNANFVLLSLIIERIESRSFAKALEERIIKPLALKNTHAGGPINSTLNEANSYFWKNKWIKNADNYSTSLLGAGAIVSTPNDVIVFLHSLFSYKILPEERLQEMIKIKDNMGLGLYSFPFYNKTAYGHSGNIDSFESFSVYFPENKTAFTILLNGNHKDFNELLIECLSAYWGYK